MEGNYPAQDYVPDNNGADNGFLRKPTIKQVGAIYFAAVLLLVLAGSRMQRFNFNIGILVTEFILVLLPPVIFLFVCKYDVKRVLRLNRVSSLNLLLVFLIMIFALPLVGVLNFANLWVIKAIFGRTMISQPPVADDPVGLLINILLIAGGAGICEEVLFRGTIQRGFERLGIAKSIWITALLFGLMHVDFQKLLGTFLLGALIGFIVYRTDSLYSGMFAHFTNNGVAVVVTWLVARLSKLLGSPETDPIRRAGAATDLDLSYFSTLPPEQLAIVIIFYAMVVAFFALAFGALMYAFIKTTKKSAVATGGEISKGDDSSMVWVLPGVLMVGFIYLAQGLKLKGVHIPVIDMIVRALGLK